MLVIDPWPALEVACLHTLPVPVVNAAAFTDAQLLSVSCLSYGCSTCLSLPAGSCSPSLRALRELFLPVLLLQLLLDLTLVVTGAFNIHSGLCSPLAAVLAQGGIELHSCHT